MRVHTTLHLPWAICLLQRMIDTQEKSKSVLRGGDFLQKTLDVELDDYCINNLMALRETYLDY